MITLKNVTKYFGSVKAVDDLSFSVDSGEVIGFLGPNGAGKTTTLRMMTGFLSPDRGSVIIDTVNIERDPVAAQKKIGYLPENNPLYTNMLVSEFLDFAARLHQVSPSDRSEAMGRVVRAVGIEEMFYRPIRELSKGFRQRVGIAAALIHEPDIIILDEPTEGLDPNQRGDIRTLIRDLAKKRTVIMSTHVMQEASAVCSRLLILNKGRLAADGTAQQLSADAKGNRVLSIDIEGDGVMAEIKRLVGDDAVSIQEQRKRRLSVLVSLGKDMEIRPDISRLVGKHHWIVWDMHEEERKLEDVFHALTKE